MPWMLWLPPIALWGLLYWQDRKTLATRQRVVKVVNECLEHGWLLERADIITLANSAARRNRLVLPVPSVDEILEETAAGLFPDIDNRSGSDASRPVDRPILESRIRQLRSLMNTIPPVRPDASTAFAIGAGIVLILMGLLLYLPASMHQPSPLEGMGPAGKTLSSLTSFWDELIGIIATNVVGLVAAWFVASPHTVAHAVFGSSTTPGEREAARFQDRW